MNKYQKLAALLSAAAILGISTGAVAESEEPNPPAMKMGITQYNFSTIWGTKKDGDTDSKSYAGLTVQVTDQFKVNTAIRLERLFEDQMGNSYDDYFSDMDWEAAVAEIEGVVTIPNGGKEPMVLVFGKSLQVLLKPRLEAVPESILNRIQPDELEEVFAIGLTMDPGFVDSLNVTISETEGGDLKVNTDNIRITAQAAKVLSERWSATASLSYETGEGAIAVSGGIVHGMDYILEDLEGFVELTHYQAGYGNLASDRNVGQIGLNYDINDQWVVSGSTEISDDDAGTEYLNRLGASFAFTEDASAYGSVRFEGTDFDGVEAGVKIKFPKKRN